MIPNLTLDVPDDFFVALSELAKKRLWKALDALTIFQSESGMNPHTKNALGYVGIGQFSPRLMKSWGLTGDQMAAKSAKEQLEYVDRFWGNHNFPTSTALYLYNFLPVFFYQGRWNEPDFILGEQNNMNPLAPSTQLTFHAVWRDNPGLRDGGSSGTVIRVSGLTHAMQRVTATARWKELAARLDEVEKGGATPPGGTFPIDPSGPPLGPGDPISPLGPDFIGPFPGHPAGQANISGHAPSVVFPLLFAGVVILVLRRMRKG